MTTPPKDCPPSEPLASTHCPIVATGIVPYRGQPCHQHKLDEGAGIKVVNAFRMGLDQHYDAEQRRSLNSLAFRQRQNSSFERPPSAALDSGPWSPPLSPVQHSLANPLAAIHDRLLVAPLVSTPPRQPEGMSGLTH
ncbi:unnamed protein product [Protopolystoma xenopodis]|uniref:Uncharacterized protein n=1 Tax=Protopolystoma xenopodis TaxID=117903 RepID=A0A3S5CHM0_9PLAT|nr:unnamed protein product [Protopolystoma xenopodis]